MLACIATTAAHARNDILTRFDHIVVPLLQDARTLHIIAHSWGTVLSYEGLRRLDDVDLSGRVANLILLGSPLSIAPVQRNLFARVADGRPRTATSGLPSERATRRAVSTDSAHER